MTAATASGRRPATISVPAVRLIVALAAAALTLVPLVFIVVAAVATGPDRIVELIVRPRVGELLRNTVGLVVVTAAACAVLGTATAWLTERTDLPGRAVWGPLCAAPLAVPAFVTSYAWVSLTSSVEGSAGAVLISTVSYFPFVHLPVAAVLRGLDPGYEDSARALGLRPWATFARVVLPQLRPALVGGCLLVGLHLLAEFGALALLRFPTFTTAIYDEYQSTFSGPAATMLAGVLVLLCLVLLVTELGAGGRARQARVGSGAARRQVPVRLGRATLPALVATGAVMVAALGVPGYSLVRWMVQGASTGVDVPAILAAAGSSIGLGLLAAVATGGLAFPVAWLSVRRRGTLSTVLERTTYVGNALPGIVVALACVAVSIRLLPALYQTTPVLIAAYAILFMPLAVVSTRAALLRVPPELEDSARALGTAPGGVLWRVTVPLVARGIGAGAALVFLGVVTELTATLLLAPTGTQTLATAFWAQASSVAYGAAAPYALLMVLISAPAAWLLTRRSLPGVVG